MANGDFASYLSGDNQGGFSNYAAGNKVYGGGRPNPTSGPVDKSGYAERDRRAKAKRNAMLRRLKARQSGRYMSSDNLSPEIPMQGAGV